jgi:GNAT superfamily N-acetyltransferase
MVHHACMIEIESIHATDYLDLAERLVREHWSECEAERMPNGPKINKELIACLEDAGCLLAIGVFDDESLVGYSLTVVAPSLHYEMVHAQCDSIFLMQAYRHGGLGFALVQRTAEYARSRGAQHISFNAKPGSAFERLLRRITGSNKPEDTVWTWRLR